MLNRLASQEGMVALARRLGIAGPLKEAYFRLSAPSDRILRVRVHGTEAGFYAPTAGEWRKLEQLGHGGSEDFLQVLASELSAGQVFYDVGSNIGEYAIILAKRVGPGGRVLAFEPVRSSYRRLKENIGVNGYTNVEAYRVALSDRPGKAKLRVHGFLSRQSRLAENALGNDGDLDTVEVSTGDRIRESGSLPIPNAVKIDVEGYEYHVLQGMRRTLAHPKCTLLCCELHPANLPLPVRPEDVEEIIGKLGFSDI